MDKCWTFYRRSTDKQELSILDQRKACQEYAKRMGWIIEREFEPVKGWSSGLTIDQDDTFKEMVRLAELRNHGVRFLLAYDVSRFGRLQAEDKIYWEQRFKRQGGIQIVYAKDEFKNDGSLDDTLHKVVKHVQANQFSVKLSELVLRGQKSHAALGHSTGGTPSYGYDRLEIDEEGKPVRVMQRTRNGKRDWKANKMHHVIWIPSPEEAAVVLWIFESYDKGMGYTTIVNSLNERGIKPPRGNHWNKPLIHYMLKNRVYLGERIYNKTSYRAYRRGERGSLNNPKGDRVIKTDAHPAIISRALFDRVQAKRDRRNTGVGQTRGIGKGRPYHSPYLLTGIAKCGRCGYSMMGWRKTGNGHQYQTYTCSGYQRVGPSLCRSVNILGEELEGLALQAVHELISDPSWRKKLRGVIEPMIVNQFGNTAKRRYREFKRTLDETNRQIANVLVAIKEHGYSDALSDELRKLENRRDDLREDLGQVEATIKVATGLDEIVEGVMQTAASFDKSWAAADSVETKKEILRGFVREVRVDHGENQPPQAHFKLHLIPENKLAGHPQGTPGPTYSLSLLRG